MGNFIDKQLFPIRNPINSCEEIRYSGEIEYIFFRNDESNTVIIYSHSGKETLDDIRVFIKDLSVKTKYSIVAYEYPNNTTASSANKAIEEIYDHMISLEDFEPNDVILMGNAIGCGPTLHLAQLIHERIKFVVLLSPFVSVRRFVTDYLGICGIGACLSQAMDERYDNEWAVERISASCPLLIIYSPEEMQYPIELFAKYKGDNSQRQLEMVDGHVLTANVLGEKIINFSGYM